MTVKERPILFSAPMVRAILDGRKSQTRRCIDMRRVDAAFARDCPDHTLVLERCEHFTSEQAEDERRQGVLTYERRKPFLFAHFAGLANESSHHDDFGLPPARCPYGYAGERLWVRETWHSSPHFDCLYRADYDDSAVLPKVVAHGGWKPGIYMPRSLSRITLKVTDVRVERLQEISATDAWAEGIYHSPDVNPVHEFNELWASINGPGSWDANPWVWAITFQRIEP